MKRLRTLWLLAPILLLAACQGAAPDTTGFEPRLEDIEAEIDRLAGSNFGDLEGRITALEERIGEAAERANEELNPPDLSGLEARLDALERALSRINSDESTPESSESADAPSRYQVVLTTYQLDNAGLHDLDEDLNSGGEIDPSAVGQVRRLAGLVAATEWPRELQPQAEGLRQTLTALGDALENDDLEAAQSLATQAHEEQHDLSHDVESWLATQEP